MASSISQRERSTILLACNERASMKPVKSLFAATALALAALGTTAAHAAGVEVLNEGFADVAGLGGWVQVNNSIPPGSAWFQGNAGLFPAQAGAADSYAAANFLGAGNGSGSVDNWLITPVLDLNGLTTLSFYTRRAADAGFSDLLEVRFSAGAGTDVDGFTALLATVGGGADFPADFPADWQQFTSSFTQLGSGRFAFHYLGPSDSLNYIGLDTVSVVTAVPEPANWLMLALGAGMLAPLARRGQAQRVG
jgi:hypothetical protein